MRTSFFINLVKMKCNYWGISVLAKICMFFLVTITVKVVQLFRPSLVITFTSSNCDFQKQTHESLHKYLILVSVPISFKEFPRFLQDPIIRSWRDHYRTTCEVSPLTHSNKKNIQIGLGFFDYVIWSKMVNNRWTHTFLEKMIQTNSDKTCLFWKSVKN